MRMFLKTPKIICTRCCFCYMGLNEEPNDKKTKKNEKFRLQTDFFQNLTPETKFLVTASINQVVVHNHVQ